MFVYSMLLPCHRVILMNNFFGVLMKRRHFVAMALLPLAMPAISAQTPVTATGDTVILIVTSPGGPEVTFSGTIVFRDKKTTQRFDNVKTPFDP
jgi:hypothetical protein